MRCDEYSAKGEGREEGRTCNDAATAEGSDGRGTEGKRLCVIKYERSKNVNVTCKRELKLSKSQMSWENLGFGRDVKGKEEGRRVPRTVELLMS